MTTNLMTLAFGQVPTTVATYQRMSTAILRLDALNQGMEADEEPYRLTTIDDSFVIVRLSRQGDLIHGLTWVLT